MSGRDRGIGGVYFSACRVAGMIDFVPPHFRQDGKLINAKSTITVFWTRGARRANGDIITHRFQMTAWGGLALSCCRSCSPGRALDFDGDINTFNKRQWTRVQDASMPGGFKIVPEMRQDGQQVVARDFIGFAIRTLVYGEESNKHIKSELAQGLRPPGWADPDHPDYKIWTGVMKERQTIQFVPGMTTFGWARVVQLGNNVRLATDAEVAAARRNNGQQVLTQQAQPQFAQPQTMGGYVAQQQQLDQSVVSAVDGGGTMGYVPQGGQQPQPQFGSGGGGQAPPAFASPQPAQGPAGMPQPGVMQQSPGNF